MPESLSNGNQSAAVYQWLAGHVAKDSEMLAAWTGVRDRMRAVTQRFISSQDWISDFWLCKTSDLNAGLEPKWAPPDEIGQWCIQDMGEWTSGLPAGQSSNYEVFAAMLAAAQPAVGGSARAVKAFYALDNATQQRADIAMMQAEHARAWLATAFGNLLMSVALTPQTDPAPLIAMTRQRLTIPKELGAAPMWGVQFGEGELGILYNCRQTVNGSRSWRGIRVGQGEEWFRHWMWLSQPMEAEVMLPALQLAARLMQCEPLWSGLRLAATDQETGELAIAVIRRWLLTLQAMAWLEQALTEHWEIVRPQDLACFAYSAVKPEWPRHALAISHRSCDVKPKLQQMKAWKSSLFAIDATYVPSWESNTGMIWGLFATTPILVRVASEAYLDSEWCRREFELIQHVRDRCDFLDGRRVVDIDRDSLETLDEVDEQWRTSAPNVMTFRDREYPPWCQVHLPAPMNEWELRMLRAAGALRTFYAVYQDADVANRLCQMLCKTEIEVPIPPPANHPGGWEELRRILREVSEAKPAEPPFLFPAGTPKLHIDEATQFVQAVPDLSSGSPSLADVLVSLEWQQTLLPVLLDASTGDMIVVDVRSYGLETWRTHPRLSLQRGLAWLRSPARPIWFLQKAEQGVHKWGLPHDRPIFTQHTETQFDWMLETSLSNDWPAVYVERCGLVMRDDLKERCMATREEPA